LKSKAFRCRRRGDGLCGAVVQIMFTSSRTMMEV
jgi:hypothetical protein